MNNLEILRNMGKLAEELENTTIPDSYWIEEAKMIDKLHEKQEKFNRSIQMSYEKYHQPYTI